MKYKRLTKKQFEVGDYVLLKYNRFGPGYKPLQEHRHKLAPLATSLKIIKKLSPISYQLELPENSRIHDVVASIHLWPFHGSPNKEPQPIVVDSVEEYEVDRIEGERKVGKESQFLVKWKGYEERTWEPMSNMTNAQETIDAWRETLLLKTKGPHARVTRRTRIERNEG